MARCSTRSPAAMVRPRHGVRGAGGGWRWRRSVGKWQGQGARSAGLRAKGDGRGAPQARQDQSEKWHAAARGHRPPWFVRVTGFAALVVVGDGGGRLGSGKGKAREVPDSVQKAMDEARRKLVKINLKNGTLQHAVTGRHGSSASRGSRRWWWLAMAAVGWEVARARRAKCRTPCKRRWTRRAASSSRSI